MPPAIFDHSQEACETFQNTAIVRNKDTLHNVVLRQHGLILQTGLNSPAVLVTNLPFKVFSGFTKTTTRTSFSEAHPSAGNRLHR